MHTRPSRACRLLGSREWELRGGLDLSQGYRFRGRITSGGVSFRENGTPIWLAGGRGTWGRRPAGYYDTLTKSSLHQREPVWLDVKRGTLGSTFNFASYVRHPPSYNELRKAALAAGRADFPSDRRISALRLRKFAME